MKNHCTFKTALALKQAGFPQPEPEAGQVWWVNKDQCFVIYDKNKDLSFGVYFGSGLNGAFDNALMDEFTFAPKAADILRELGHLYPVRFNGSEFQVDPDMYPNETYLNNNPAEVCAAAWLDLKKLLRRQKKNSNSE